MTSGAGAVPSPSAGPSGAPAPPAWVKRLLSTKEEDDRIAYEVRSTLSTLIVRAPLLMPASAVAASDQGREAGAFLTSLDRSVRSALSAAFAGRDPLDDLLDAAVRCRPCELLIVVRRHAPAECVAFRHSGPCFVGRRLPSRDFSCHQVRQRGRLPASGDGLADVVAAAMSGMVIWADTYVR